eukprot:1597542-Pyramimonas_sp.AAC.1
MNKQAGREGRPRRPGREGGLLKRESCMNREAVSSDSAIPKQSRQEGQSESVAPDTRGRGVDCKEVPREG